MRKLSGRHWVFEQSSKAASCNVGDDLEISAELVDARDNSHIWGQQYSRKSSDIFVAAGTTCERNHLHAADAPIGRRREAHAKSYTANPEAYQLYLKGRFWWNKSKRGGI